MDIFSNSNWFLTKCLLSSFGAWPFQTLQFRNVLRCIVAFIVCSILIPEMIRIFTIKGNMSVLVECVSTLLLHLLTAIKMINCIANFTMGRKLLKIIENDRATHLSPEDNQTLHNYENQNRIITHGYIYYIYITTLMFMGMPMVPKVLDYLLPLNDTRPTIFLYEAEYFLDRTIYRNWILLHSYIITPFPATIVLAFDSLYANFVDHACSMFLITSHRMENLACKYKKNSLAKHYDVNVSLMDCIAHHRKALKFAHLLRTTYSKALFFVLAINMLSISITGFQTVMKLNEASEAFRFGSYTIAQLIHLYFLSWPGQKLKDHSEYIHTAVYQGNWYNMPLRLQKLLIVIMMTSSEACVLTAGEFYIMSLQSFSLVLKTSVSYFTVLISFQ